MLRRAYIYSAGLHFAALALLLLLAQLPAQQSQIPRRYQPVRLVAPPGMPGPSSRTEPAQQTKSEAPAQKPQAEERKVAEKPDKAKAVAKSETKPTTAQKVAGKESPGGKPQTQQQTGTSAVSGTGTGGGGGSSLQLDGADFPYPYYLSNIQIKILSNFKPTIGAKEAKELKAVVYFMIDKSGKISNVKLEEKSGHFLFDQEAQRAVLRSNPLPALPPAFGSDRLGVHFEFVGTP
jgi:colicin import membrane protein